MITRTIARILIPVALAGLVFGASPAYGTISSNVSWASAPVRHPVTPHHIPTYRVGYGTIRDANLGQIKDLEVVIHRNQTSKNVDAFMSVWDRDATLTIGGNTYSGTQQIRDFWATKSAAFKPENNWIELTATQRMVTTMHGNQGTFHFECYFLDIPTKVVKAIMVVDTTVVRRNGRWWLKTVSIAPLANLSAAG